MKKLFLVLILFLISWSISVASGTVTGGKSMSRPNKVIYYSEYGAVGDGITDDFEAIIKAHARANETGWKVYADAGATYYIGGADKTALIQTDTDWGNARFIIDDTKVENRNAQIFKVSSKLSPIQVTTVKTLGKNQEKLDLSLPHHSFITVTDTTTKRYIRFGLNQNRGSSQTDVFVVDENGKVDMKAPIIWDFNNISMMTAYPIDAQTLTIRGGHFTTVANQAESRYTYYSRGIGITRSNVVVDGVTHVITGELDHGAPYGGFLIISNCTGVTIQNCKLSGHKTYVTIGAANAPVSMGSYDISVGRSTHVTFKNCKQINDIHDTKLWGIFGSNYSKNITFDGVEFSRFDAHMGVANATIKNSVLGHQGINIIGSGVFLIENTKVCGTNFINLRSDYGSTFEGEFIIKNCEYVPRNGAQSDAVLISGSYSGEHDFGYTCYMPRKITIDGLVINDSNPMDNYQGPKIFAPFNPAYTSEAYKEKYPYVITQQVEIRNLTVKSGKKYIISNNPFMFRNVRITESNLFARDQNLISGKYSLQELQRILVPQAEWTPFPRLDDRAGWAKADKDMMQVYIKTAESYLDYDWPTIPATLSLLIVRTGNRTEYQNISFKKRTVLATMILAEIMENKGRFIDQIINGIWSVCEESWWGVPAHLPKTKEISGLMDVNRPFVDLFAAATGSVLAWADYFLGDQFDEISPQIRKRIYHEVNYRLMEPLMNQKHGWMYRSENGKGPNNWNPWICSNWINFVLLLEKDDFRRTEMIARALTILDEFLNPYPQDGGCDEGPSYWGAAAASLYDNISLLNLAANDNFRYVYDDERFKNMGRFIYRAQISENYFLNFADAPHRMNVSATMVYRYGKDIGDKDMMEFGAYFRRPASGNADRSHYFRDFFALFIQDEFRSVPPRQPLLRDVWLPDLQVAIARDREGTAKGFYLAAKGGRNDESHNHNDIGSYVIYYDGQPLLIDIGSGTYTAKTFSDRRYEIWYNRSDYHNIPTVNATTQSPGREYQASDVTYKSDKSSVVFSLDMAKAYPEETAVNSWKRTITLNRDKNVAIKDAANLQKAESIMQHMMTCYPAQVTSPGELTIYYKDGDGKNIDFVVKYNSRQMRVNVEKIEMGTEEDQGVLSRWGDSIHRINFEVIAPKTKDTFVFDIRKK